VGCGLSDKPKEDRYDYTLSRRVEDLEALLAHLGISENITLIVHDWGGMIGMAFASRHPEAVKRLVVFNTSGFHLPKGKKFPWQLHLVRNTPLGAFLVRGLNLFCLGAAQFCCTRKPMPKDVRQAYLSPYDSWENRVAILRFVQDIPLSPGDPSYDIVTKAEESLAKFKDTPILICWGEKDFIFDKDFLAGWIERFPKAKVHRFPDAGHYVLEDAAEEIVPLVKEFLAEEQPSVE
jgi:haloalkane dehalogenase